MSYSLVIVESPAKAKTIAGYLGDGFRVESSIGHVRDLPMRAADIPASHRDKKWAKLGIDVENDFEPLYIVSRDKKEQITRLRSLLKGADQLYLATDEDREGEAIAWHLLEVLKPKVPVHRMVFHEITNKAITDALSQTRDIDEGLVNAQETRRILDRLYGYELSPVLWKMISKGLSAGRVQSVATRIVVERERERMAFQAAGYWDLKVQMSTDASETFASSLIEVDGARVATGRDFDDDGALSREGAVVLDEAAALNLADGLVERSLEVGSVEAKPYRRRPAAPFITSTYQQEAGRRLRMSAAMAMHAAQGLYQKGYITYMRTDSTTLSDTAVRAARAQISELFGDDHLPESPRTFQKKVRNAQEAHEAIRPAGDRFRHPDEVARELPRSEARAYEMIWQRTLASQMTDAVGETVQIRVVGTSAGPSSTSGVTFATSGTVISHQGFRRVYADDSDDRNTDGDGDGGILPAVDVGDPVVVVEATPEGHTTQPPSRFTEASLVKRLEELGVGRPSTYASIMETIQGRDYVWKKGSALVPTLSAFAVTTLLESHFPRLVDYDFTASMESDLDGIADGSAEKVPWLRSFYFGSSDDIGLLEKVTGRLGDIDARAVSTVPLGVTSDGEEVVARFGKFGPYVQVGDRTASIPDDLAPDELTVERAFEFLDTPVERVLGDDPETGLPVIARSGRFGPYVSLGRPPEQTRLSPEMTALMALPLRRTEMKVAVSYLRLAAGSDDEAAFRRVINTPRRGVGKGAMERINEFAAQDGDGFLDALGHAEEAGVTGRPLAGIRSFLELREVLVSRSTEGPATVLRIALDDSGYLAELRTGGDDNSERIRNLDDLVLAVAGFDNVGAMLEEVDEIATADARPRPRTASLFQTMTLERLTLQDALELLSLPRTVGVDPADGVEITVQNGRFGPYLKKGSDSRSLATEEQLLTVTLEECLTVLAQPKRRGRSTAKPPLRELGADPESGKTIILKDGNWGPYVTDGEYNASLGRGDSVEELTDERAAELLAERRAKGPPGKKKRSSRKK
ncbi:MAG: type I DNA topoisomerase [Acidimicrobiales bacterium]|jgi:DNA topoisomerase-1|nr:type I DNA topoisomerase [Acidimicrobiales bacterium]MDP7208868.1 type I DNA topoisomerase [Acidimicrobiales bacterium]HJO98756.1 type I DNA topoisomerase [Acidimicrobiales bacterium]|tara:strand:+ start:20820 stop:23918 length:3099 start_codon:yes stop_codon:yes gene_type:complete